MCVITEAFLTIAQAQQKALDYPTLPFVMLAHPVAVATETERQEKVERIYQALVAALTQNSPAVSNTQPEPVAEGTTPRPQAVPSPRLTHVVDILTPLRTMLQHDGADLQVTSVENGTVHVRLVCKPNVCVECIPEHDQLTGMIRDCCQTAGETVTTVLLDDPR